MVVNTEKCVILFKIFGFVSDKSSSISVFALMSNLAQSKCTKLNVRIVDGHVRS